MGKYRIVTVFKRGIYSPNYYFLYHIVEHKKFLRWKVLNETSASDGLEVSKKFIEDHKKLNRRIVVHTDP